MCFYLAGVLLSTAAIKGLVAVVKLDDRKVMEFVCRFATAAAAAAVNTFMEWRITPQKLLTDFG